MKLLIAIVTFIVISACLGQFYTVSAEEIRQQLKLASQGEGPPLEETLKWIKQKIESSVGTCNNFGTIISTDFNIYNQYDLVLQQEFNLKYNLVLGEKVIKEAGRWVYIYKCDLPGVNNSQVDDVALYLRFNEKCEVMRISPSGVRESNANSAIEICIGNLAITQKLVKAFEHTEKLLDRAKQKSDNDLF